MLLTELTAITLFCLGAILTALYLDWKIHKDP